MLRDHDLDLEDYIAADLQSDHSPDTTFPGFSDKRSPRI